MRKGIQREVHVVGTGEKEKRGKSKKLSMLALKQTPTAISDALFH
jgi:hypothetical protein